MPEIIGAIIFVLSIGAINSCRRDDREAEMKKTLTCWEATHNQHCFPVLLKETP